jgi:putative colanic acid biosynthesis acetyltransferase WcaF
MNDILIGIDPHTQPSFTLANRLRRLVWGLTAAVLYRPTPRPFHAWRAFLLRCFGAKLGSGCHFYPHVIVWAPWNLEAADQVVVGNGVNLYNMAKISIGRRAVISQGAHLCCGGHDYEDPTFQLIVKPISIGENAWVCAEAFVSAGVTVGEGAVIGARSVLVSDAEPWSVYVGHPAKLLKPRTTRIYRKRKVEAEPAETVEAEA